MWRRLIITLFVICFSAGCASTRTSDSWPRVSWRADDVQRSLAYFDSIRRLNTNDLHKEYEAVKQTYSKNKSDLNRIQLALLLSLPGTSFSEPARAMELLDPVARDNKERDAGVRNLAVLLRAMISEQIKSAGGTEILEQKLKEEQRRSDLLQQKLEALTSIDRNLSERERALPRKK